MIISSVFLIFLFADLCKYIHGLDCTTKFFYKHPNQHVCLTCRICPTNITHDHHLYKLHVQTDCLKYPALPDGRLPHCHGRNNPIPSCEQLTPKVGFLRCDRNNEFDSRCQLECPTDSYISADTNVTCTTDLTWNGTLPTCRKLLDPKSTSDLSTAATIGIVVVSAFLVILVLLLYKLIQGRRSFRDIEKGIEENVSINVQHAVKRSRKKNPQEIKWVVNKGSLVVITAVSKYPSLPIQSLLCLNTSRLGSKLSVQPVYSTLPGSPSQIPIKPILSSHHGVYTWIARLEDGTTSQGTFKLSVQNKCKHPGAYSPQECDEQTSLTSQEDISHAEGVPDKSQSLGTERDIIEDIELTHLEHEAAFGDSVEGFHRLMRCRDDVRALYQLLDREKEDGELTWHTLATSPLLQFDDDFIRFLEYHLKGQLYGPTRHIMELMKQRGTTVAQLVNILRDYKPSSNQLKSIHILKKYSDCP